MTNLPAKSLTSQQLAFLNALSGDAKGNVKQAAEIAGYSPKTRMVDIVTPLKDHIINVIKDILVQSGPSAAFGLVDAIIDPSIPGTQHRIKAATEILDRIGVVKPENSGDAVNKPAIFILPPKGVNEIKVSTEGAVTIDMKDEKVISTEPLDEPEEDEGRDYNDPRLADLWKPLEPLQNLDKTPETP